MSLKEQDYIEIKVLIGNLLNCFPTNRIRGKDMPRFNQELNDIIKDIETRVNASPSDNNKIIQSSKCHHHWEQIIVDNKFEDRCTKCLQLKGD